MKEGKRDLTLSEIIARGLANIGAVVVEDIISYLEGHPQRSTDLDSLLQSFGSSLHGDGSHLSAGAEEDGSLLIDDLVVVGLI